MPTPVIVITGLEPAAMSLASIGLIWDLPTAVVVRHEVDCTRQQITRVVSDAHGLAERDLVPIDHWCMSCGVVNDLLPTLVECAKAEQWGSIIAVLPPAATADELCDRIARDPELRAQLSVRAVITGLAGDFDSGSLARDLTSNTSLEEFGLAVCHGTDGLAETLSALIEEADVAVITDPCTPPGDLLVRAIGREHAITCHDPQYLTAEGLLMHRHHHPKSRDQRTPAAALPESEDAEVWQVTLETELPLHPGRLAEALPALANRGFHVRGCLWLPSRPRQVLTLRSVGGRFQLGNAGTWGEYRARTRLIFTGTGEQPDNLTELLAGLLVRATENQAGMWTASSDGLEPWLDRIGGQVR